MLPISRSTPALEVGMPVSLAIFGAFLMTELDSFPITASSVARFFHMKGSVVECYYKDILSDFDGWIQKDHSKKWMLVVKNLGLSAN